MTTTRTLITTTHIPRGYDAGLDEWIVEVETDERELDEDEIVVTRENLAEVLACLTRSQRAMNDALDELFGVKE